MPWDRGTEGCFGVVLPSGILKQYFLRTNTVIQGIPCESGLVNQFIELHENGQLKDVS